MVDIPENLRLFGRDDAEREQSRKADRLRLEFDDVPTALSYELEVNGSSIPFANREWIQVGLANTRYDLRVRALDQNGYSDWSTYFSTVTRPPKPNPPSRVPYDLLGWGIGFEWTLVDNFPGSENASLSLLRTQDDENAEILVANAPQRSEYVDTDYERHVLKDYWLRYVIAREMVPGDLLGSENYSEDSQRISAANPFSMTQNQTPLLADNLDRSRARIFWAMYGVKGQ